MTTNSTQLVKHLQQLLGETTDGLAVQAIQQMLWERFRLKLSYRDIEQALIHNSELFNEQDWKWVNRSV
jgi:hypothetical protein